MPSLLSRHQVLRILIGRALVLFVLITLAVSALRIESPIGLIIIVGALGWVDVRRRNESLFWANLGYSFAQIMGVFIGVAIVGQLFVSSVVRPLIETTVRNAR